MQIPEKPETPEIPEELTRFWNDVCDRDLQFAIEICAQYEEYIDTQINLLKALICDDSHVKSNKQDLQFTEEILHRLTGSLALLGFDLQSHYLHSLEKQFINKTASLDRATFDNIHSQVSEVSTLIRQHCH